MPVIMSGVSCDCVRCSVNQVKMYVKNIGKEFAC